MPCTCRERYWMGEIFHEAHKCLPLPGPQRELDFLEDHEFKRLLCLLLRALV